MRCFCPKAVYSGDPGSGRNSIGMCPKVRKSSVVYASIGLVIVVRSSTPFVVCSAVTPLARSAVISAQDKGLPPGVVTPIKPGA